jgi:hypothetical protein
MRCTISAMWSKRPFLVANRSSSSHSGRSRTVASFTHAASSGMFITIHFPSPHG